MFPQQSPKLIFKRHPRVMRRLIGDILAHRFDLRMTHGKRRIAALPSKLGVGRNSRIAPLRRVRFNVSDQVSEQCRGANGEQRVDVIHVATDNSDNCTFVAQRTRKICEQVLSDFLRQNWPPALSRENYVKMDLRKGIRRDAALPIDFDGMPAVDPSTKRCPSGTVDLRRRDAAVNCQRTQSMGLAPQATLRRRYAAVDPSNAAIPCFTEQLPAGGQR